jgi:tetratricopeptide (TPR) repeat protein
MFRVKATVLCVCGAFGLASCASLTTSKTGQPWTVQPVFSVNDAGPKADAMYRLGRFYQGQRRYAEAIAAYRQALAPDPGYADAQNGLGVIYAEQGRHAEAVKAFQAAIAAAPRAAYLHNNLGYVLLLQGSNEKAVEVLEEARRLEPDNAKVRDNLIIGYERLIEEKQARRPVQPDTNTTVAAESKAESAKASVEVRTAPDSGVRLVAVAPAVYELQAPGAEAAGAQKKHGADAAVPAATVVSPERGSAAPTYVLTTASGTQEVQVHDSPTTIEANANATEAARPDEARQQELEAFKLEVSNGNGVGGMAARVAGYLARFGVSTGRLTNDKPFSQPTTLIQYREGYRTQAARIGSMLPKAVPVVQAGALRSDIHVRVVLGRDVRHDVALFDAERSKIQLAAEASEQTAR